MGHKRKLPLEDDRPLNEVDPVMHDLLEKEINRQRYSMNLIASENYAGRASLDLMGSIFTNKYSEGFPKRRYMGGCKYIDEVESLCIQRCLDVFGLSSEEWGVNVQPLSGTPANLAVLFALLQPHDKLMGLSLDSGGHLTHGIYTLKKKTTVSSYVFSSLQFKIDPKTGLIDYDELEKMAKAFCPKLIIAGASIYARFVDYKRFRQIADSVGAYLLSDVSSVTGFIAAGLHPSPFEYSHVVTSTTHETMKGPRSGIILFNKKLLPDFGECINNAVFPLLQGGPHNNKIASLAAHLYQLMKPEWKAYAQTILDNAKELAEQLKKRGFKLVTGGTDNHMIIIDLRPLDISGIKVELVSDLANVTLHRNTLVGDTSAYYPSGVVVGTPSLTSRGALPSDMVFVADVIKKVVDICLKVQEVKGRKVPDFVEGLEKNEDILKLKSEVIEWIKDFPCVY